MSSSSKDVRFSEKISFALGIGSQNIMYGFVTTYVMIYFTDIFGISAAFAGTIILISGLWDAVNDPLMGVLADKTRTKWGKFRPYMLASIPAAIMFVLLFTVPDISPAGKAVWALVTYLLYQMFYTIVDIPIWSITAVMTTNTNKRTAVLTFGKIAAQLGLILPIVMAPILIKELGGGAKGHQSLAIIIAAISVLFIPMIFFFVKERVIPSSNRPSAGKLFKVILKNKPLLLLLSSHLIRSIATALLIATLTYFTKYNLGNEEKMMDIMILYFGPALLGMIAIPLLSKVFDKKKLIIVTGLLQVAAFAALFLVGYKKLSNILIVVGFVGLFMGLIEVLIPSMFNETIDYSEWKLGTRAEGMVWSTQTLAAKAGTAVGGIVLGTILTDIGYVKNAVQTAAALDGIHITISIVVGCIYLISIIPLCFYTLTKKKYKELMSELKVKRADEPAN